MTNSLAVTPVYCAVNLSEDVFTFQNESLESLQQLCNVHLKAGKRGLWEVRVAVKSTGGSGLRGINETMRSPRQESG